MQDKMVPQFEVLLKKAHSDLAIAISGLQSDNEEIDNETILFHLHQAAEKYLSR